MAVLSSSGLCHSLGVSQPQHNQPLFLLFKRTVKALLAPRRLVPIILVCLPMIAAQARFSAKYQAAYVAVVICILFVGIAPFSWRALFPRGQHHSFVVGRLLLYGALGSIPSFASWILPQVFHLGATFLGVGPYLLIVASALFWVGGWGLARDIELEEGLQQARARALELEREAERAQLLALRAHLDPHFLFNTLNAIAEWCREDGELAEQAILKLSALLRQVFAGVKAPSWPLATELKLLRDLLELHRIRDPERFSVEWQVPDPAPEVEIPPLLMLPLVENAVKHGPAKGHRGPLVVRVAQDRDGVRVEVGNPGAFVEPRPGGEGLRMVQRRLELAYGKAASFRIGAERERTLAVVELPNVMLERAT